MQQIGIVGRGYMSRVHARRYAAMPDARVAAVASPSGPEAFVDKFAPEATAYADPEAMFEDAALDAVDVCTPTDTHRDLVVAAAERGLDVRCEKPLARTLADAREIRTAVDDAGVTCLPGHVVRFFPAYERAKARVDSGEIGSVGNVRCRRRTPVADLTGWFHDRERSGGTLLDLAIHDFDFLRWVCGDVERVYAQRSRWDDAEATLTTLRFESGTVGHVDARWTNEPDAAFAAGFELAGDAGLVEFEDADSNPISVQGRVDIAPADGVDVPLARDPYRRQLDHFVACVRGDETPKLSVDDATDSLRVSLAALASAESGEPVTVADLTA